MTYRYNQELLAELNSFKTLLVNDGYTILPSASYTTEDALYTTIFKNGKFLQIYFNRYLWNVSSVYIACKQHGNGSKIAESDSLSLELINSCLDSAFLVHRSINTVLPTFYNSISHYLEINKHWH